MKQKLFSLLPLLLCVVYVCACDETLSNLNPGPIKLRQGESLEFVTKGEDCEWRLDGVVVGKELNYEFVAEENGIYELEAIISPSRPLNTSATTLKWTITVYSIDSPERVAASDRDAGYPDVRIEWEPVEDAEYYLIYRKNFEGDEQLVGITTNGNPLTAIQESTSIQLFMLQVASHYIMSPDEMLDGPAGDALLSKIFGQGTSFTYTHNWQREVAPYIKEFPQMDMTVSQDDAEKQHKELTDYYAETRRYVYTYKAPGLFSIVAGNDTKFSENSNDDSGQAIYTHSEFSNIFDFTWQKPALLVIYSILHPETTILPQSQSGPAGGVVGYETSDDSDTTIYFDEYTDGYATDDGAVSNYMSLNGKLYPTAINPDLVEFEGVITVTCFTTDRTDAYANGSASVSIIVDQKSKEIVDMTIDIEYPSEK